MSIPLSEEDKIGSVFENRFSKSVRLEAEIATKNAQITLLRDAATELLRFLPKGRTREAWLTDAEGDPYIAWAFSILGVEAIGEMETALGSTKEGNDG